MRKIILYLPFIFLLTCHLNVAAQYDPDKVCRIEDGKIIFSLNLKWSEKEKKEISLLFDLDSTLISKVYKGESKFSFDGEEWKVLKIKPGVVELSKSFLSKATIKEVKPDDLFILIDKWMNFAGKSEIEPEVYGVNNFEISYSFQYDKSAWIYLAGNKAARNVYISGSFNGWSTSQHPMKAVETGWTADLNLSPGKYTYKFIVDGKWITDPYNNLREDDGAGGYNSVLYCPNHHFRLKGNDNARKIAVAGNFNNWNPKELFMTKTSDGWSLPIYLRDGTYAYKFIVDNRWYTDPANSSERKDAHGNINSVLSIGEPYLFLLEGFTDARQVVLTGSFNSWKTDELLMEKSGKGWQLPYILPAGNYEYKFIVDGKWHTDPANPLKTGSGNYENSYIALKANHLFELDNYQNAKNVVVTGTFSNWSKNGYRMIKQDGKWVFPIFLKSGKWLYKFIVDGEWIIDPSNPVYESNEVGTNNSVIWIKP